MLFLSVSVFFSASVNIVSHGLTSFSVLYVRVIVFITLLTSHVSLVFLHPSSQSGPLLLVLRVPRRVGGTRCFLSPQPSLCGHFGMW